MVRDPDEEALRWGDDHDATHVDARPVEFAEPSAIDELTSAFADGQETPPEGTADARPSTALSSLALVLLGIVGGIYLLYTLGWLASVLRDGSAYGEDQPVQRVLYQCGQVLAVVAAPLWFAATLCLARPALVRRGLPWLVAGLVLLAPWPFLLAV